jgi:NAD(P)-dependent dehydrogenase (short-subunit alcohol dehydrogenase family)
MVVTGGSKGIGLGEAYELLTRGAHVGIVARNPGRPGAGPQGAGGGRAC